MADRTNIVSPVKYVGVLEFTVRKTLNARETESVVIELVYALLMDARAPRLMTASRGSVANLAPVAQAVTGTIARLIAIAESRLAVANVET